MAGSEEGHIKQPLQGVPCLAIKLKLLLGIDWTDPSNYLFAMDHHMGSCCAIVC